jgi:hypothetical protein
MFVLVGQPSVPDSDFGLAVTRPDLIFARKIRSVHAAHQPRRYTVILLIFQ